MKNNKTFDTLSWCLIVIAIILAIFAFCAPQFYTEKEKSIDFINTGQIGDTIGGTMSPFIGLVSIIVMFLAFYMQFTANKMMQSQFERNQFENQFFEMLKTHKENSNAITSTHYEHVEGSEFQDVTAYKHMDTRKKGFEYLVGQINTEYDEWKKLNKNRDNKDNFHSAYQSIWEDSFGHYFRHLFLIVKFVVSKPESFLNYEEKRNYLRILRASLSTYEQIFLYYNWLSGFGRQWEEDNVHGNHFFTNYRMIHNVSFAIHTDFSIKETAPFSDLLKSKDYCTEKGRNKNDDTLFELIK